MLRQSSFQCSVNSPISVKASTPDPLKRGKQFEHFSRIFRRGLKQLGIRHQRTDPGCPWQNGRIERLFGTLKQKLDQWQVADFAQLNIDLKTFRYWYNHVRPHQNLDGRTPAEAWSRIDPLAKAPKQERWFEAWDGLLAGYELRY